MTDIQEQLEEIRDLGLYRRMRLISGPQGPRVLLDGRPVLLLCSNNYLGLADHPRVREAAADAAMRWGVGAREWGLREAGGRGALIVTDGIFSMDGDIAPLEDVVELAQRYDARVMVDDAHGMGTIGPGGRGAVADAGLEDEVDVVVGTLGKALGSYGAYVCCAKSMAKWLVNSARTLIFSTAL